MKINNINIKRFRGFSNVSIDLGKVVTVIAGLNGTQKTTLLGVISQPFSLKNHPTMKDARPLCGGTYVSAFSDKFKFSETYDKAHEHEWTMNMDEGEPFTVESINRDKESGNLRFWKKGNRSAGSGYMPWPVIYLSLRRLNPIGEDEDIHVSDKVSLTNDEIKYYAELHGKILISLDDVVSADYIESKQKTTLGFTSSYYDWKQNSAGQDNIGKIILALLSFRRLKMDYCDDYRGGLLVIDELDATLYPGAQEKIFDVLYSECASLGVQLVFTTHSLTLLNYSFAKQSEKSLIPTVANDIKVVYLEKRDKMIKVIPNITFDSIQNRLKVAIGELQTPKIHTFAEDAEGIELFKCLMRGTGMSSHLEFENVPMSCANLIELAYKGLSSFVFPNALLVLDGDVKTNATYKRKLGKIKGVVYLPTTSSPERMLANYMYNLSDEHPLWDEFGRDYTKHLCFREYSLIEINIDREKAKNWFRQQNNLFKGKWCQKVIKHWKRDHAKEYQTFAETTRSKINEYHERLGWRF